MPVGTIGSPDANRLAQISHEDGGSRTLESREPAERTIVGGGKVDGVSIGGEESRGDLNNESEEPLVVTVSDSSDLNALAQAVALASFGENITIENSTFTRTPGGINIDAGTIFERTLTLRNSTFAADVIKARGFQNGGRNALIIDGSRFDASTLVRLYAEGASTLRFRGDVEINSPNTQLAGQTIRVDAGGRVRASGNVKINATNHHYDTAGFGTIEAAGSKNTSNYESRSRY
ncbi:MAG: hypothetical protein ACI9R3_005934 [Verrucomicrobiales bacterium]